IFTSSEQAVDVWAASAPSTPRAAIEADVAEHLEQRDGALRYRYCQSCVVSLYGELAVEPPPPETLRAETLLLYAPTFGLVREELEREMRLAVGQAAANGRPDSRCEGRVDDVHVEADVDESGAGDVRQRLAYRALDADPVDVAHREDLRVEMPEELPFRRVER